MRISKKILAIALSILMAVSMMPFTVFANDATVLTNDVLATDTYSYSNYVHLPAGEYVLGEDVTITDKIVVPYGGDVVLDMGGHNLSMVKSSGHSYVQVCNTSLTVKGDGNITTTGYSDNGSLFVLYGNKTATGTTFSELTIDNNVNITTQGYGILACSPNHANDCVVNIKGGSITAGNAALGINGNVQPSSNTVVNISGGTLTGETAIYAAGYATWNITGGTLTGKTGIYAKSGQLNISDGATVIGNGEAADFTHNGNGYNPTGAAIVVENAAGYSPNLDVNITGGTFESTQTNEAVQSFDYSSGTDTREAVSNFVSGGTFIANKVADELPATYLAEGAEQDPTTGDVTQSYVAKIGSTYYATLAEAIASVSSGSATIELVSDADVASTITVDNGVKYTINMNGKTISSQTRVFNIRHGGVTLTGNGTVETTATNSAVAVYGSTNSNDADYATFTLGADTTISAPNCYGAMIGSNPATSKGDAYGAKLTLNGTINSAYGVYINGNVQEPADKTNAAQITINGEVTASNEEAAVYAAGYAKWTVNEGSALTGGSGIYIKSGDLTVNGGTITATGAKTAYAFNSNGANGTGDAIIIDSCGYPGNVPTVKINGGTVTSDNGKAVASYTKQDDPRYSDAKYPRVDNVVTGNSTAVFSSDVSDLAEDDYKTVYDTDKGGYVIAPIAYGTIGLYQAGDATITGNGTAHEKITIANSSLNYAAKDYSVARYWDAYYMGGIKFIAPEGTVISENARYTNGSVDAQTGELIVKNLYNAKDGTNYMYSWPHVTEESLKEAIDAGVNKTWTYTFDWDGDGYFEQEAIIELVCNSVKLVKDGEEVYPNANNGYSLTVDKKTSMNAYIDVNAYVENENNAKLVVTYNNADELNPSKTGTTTEELYINDVDKDGERRWIVNIVQAPAQIADEVKIEVIENGVVKREIVTSVADYLVQASTSDDESLANLAKAMYDYGKATYEAGFAQNTHYVAPNNFTHAYFNNALLDGDVVNEAKLETSVGTVCRFIELAYVATNTPSLRAYVGKRDKTNPYVYLTEDEAVAAGLDHVCISDATGNICVNLGSVNPDEFYKELEVRINDGASIKTNVLAYANLAYTSNNAQSNALGRSMFNYYTAARNYWA